MSLSGIQKLIEQKLKKQDKLIKDFDSKLEGFKRGFAQQIAETRKAIEQLGGLISKVAKEVDKQLEKINKKPCMKITEIFTPEEVAKLKSIN